MAVHKNSLKNHRPPLVVLVGPTASGKTALAVKLAKKLNGEIISADSRAVYRYLDIGVAKPTLGERQGVPHWGMDLVNPGERFSVADFQRYANRKIDQIRRRGGVPFLVGGSGLYVDAVIFNYTLVGGLDYNLERKKYSDMSLEQLWEYCHKNNILLPENWKNKRYVINTIVRNGKSFLRRSRVIDNCVVFGVKTDVDVLKARIDARAEAMFSGGVIEEATRVAELFGWDNEAMTGNVYPIVRQYLDEKITLSQAIQMFKQSDWRLVKRQLTWFKRNTAIDWVDLPDAESKIIQKVSNMLI